MTVLRHLTSLIVIGALAGGCGSTPDDDGNANPNTGAGGDGAGGTGGEGGAGGDGGSGGDGGFGGDGGGSITEIAGTRSAECLDLEGLAIPAGGSGLLVQDARRVGDGTLVFGSRSTNTRMIFLLDADGCALDPSFAEEGLLEIAGGSGAHGHALDGQGRILTLNDHGLGIHSLQRHTASGQLDTSFGTQGELRGTDHPDDTSTPWSGSSSHTPRALVALNDDGVIWAGTTKSTFNNDWAFGRVNADGKVVGDTIRIVPPVEGSKGGVVQLLADEASKHLYALGTAQDEHFVARLNLDDLSLDSGYGDAGFVSLALTLPNRINDLLLDPQGRLVLAGVGPGQAANVNNAKSGAGFHVYRLTEDGAFDATFGDDGKVVIDFGSGGHLTQVFNDTATQLLLASSNELLVLGHTRSQTSVSSSSPNGPWFTMARLLDDGALDRTFAFTDDTTDVRGKSLRIGAHPEEGRVAGVFDGQGRLMVLSSQIINSGGAVGQPNTTHPVMVQWFE